MQSSKEIHGISCGLVDDDNIYVWEVMLMISDDCKYYGGMLMQYHGMPRRFFLFLQGGQGRLEPY